MIEGRIDAWDDWLGIVFARVRLAVTFDKRLTPDPVDADCMNRASPKSDTRQRGQGAAEHDGPKAR
jgi:hypothetical protein